MDSNRYVKFFDTTLRDGEQSPGVAMSSEQKLEIARQLARLGVDVIEAGFPASSPNDLASIRRIATIVGNEQAGKSGRTPIICAFARTTRRDIDLAMEAIRNARRPRLHTCLATSPIHRKYKLGKTTTEILAAIHEWVSYARSLCEDVEFSAEDAGRTESDFLYEALTVAIKAGASTLNIPDTVGYNQPEEYAVLIRGIIANVDGVGGITLSTHCHDDLGLAVANTLTGVAAGARQVEVCINGIGERAGNAALEEVVMALQTRRDYFDVNHGIDTTLLTSTSRLVSEISGMVVQPNKAIVGRNAFAHEAGIHQDGILKHRGTYEIMRPESVGLDDLSLVLGKHSGRHALRERLQKLGLRLEGAELDDVFARFKAVAEQGKKLMDHDLIELVGQVQNLANPRTGA